MDEIFKIVQTDTVVFFSKSECPNCDKLQSDLVSIGIPFKKVTLESHLRDDLVEYTKCKTVPQLFIGGKFIGGYREFTTLCGTGKLEALLEPYGLTANIDF